MRYAIQIEQQNGRYHASVLTVPTLTKSASSRSEVLRLIEEALLEHVKRTEIVYVDIPTVDARSTAVDHWLATAGIFADDPTLLPMLDEIYAERDHE
jgi:predicted RNase H-like HicB family nuclease